MQIADSQACKNACKKRIMYLICLQELKTALGGRVKHLEAELAKSETAREELRGKREAEIVQVRFKLQT